MTGASTIVIQNAKCQILNSTNSYLIYKFDGTTKQYQLYGDATTAASTLTISRDSIWATSIECDRIRINYNVFMRVNATSYSPVNNSFDFFPLDVDANLTYALGADQYIWRFDPSINGYTKLSSSNSSTLYTFI